MEKTNKKDIFLLGIMKQNPVLVMLLGTCPTLAVTSRLADAIGMSLAFALVLILTNVIISLIRKLVPNEIRIPVYIIVIATIVTFVELLVKAYAFSIYQSLGLFLSLIVVNCIVLGRAEAFASKNNVLDSFIDACSMAIGFAIALILVSTVREFLATGGLVFTNPINGSVIFDTKHLFIDNNYVNFLKNPYKVIKEKGSEPVAPKLVQFRNRVAIPLFGEATGAFLTLGFLIAAINAIRLKKMKTKEEK